jgi:protein-S-isoprenylcysteine O-methyltransferase Ste14
MKTLFIAMRTCVFVTAFFWMWLWLALSVRPYDTRWDISLPSWTRAPGIVLIVLGGALALACNGLFTVRGRGTPAPFDAPRVFVANGPYRYVRNPMYIGGMTLLAGLALVERSISILLFTAGWFVLAHLFVILYEEPTLRRKFGRTYEDYCRTVPRWIPARVL